MGKRQGHGGKRIDRRKFSAVRSGSGSALEHVSLLEKGGRVIALTGGQYSILGIILECMEKGPGPVDLVVGTWTVGLPDARVLARELERGKISRLRVIIDRSFMKRHPHRAPQVVDLLGETTIRTTVLHAKFALVKVGDWRIVVRSTMNLNKNRRIEIWEADDDPAVYAWLLALCDDLWEIRGPGFCQTEALNFLALEELLGADADWSAGRPVETPGSESASDPVPLSPVSLGTDEDPWAGASALDALEGWGDPVAAVASVSDLKIKDGG